MSAIKTDFQAVSTVVAAALARNDREFLIATRELIAEMVLDGACEALNVAAFFVEYLDGALEYAPDSAPVRTADRVTVADARAAAAAIPAPASGYYTVTLADGGAHVTIRIADDFRAGSTAKIAGYLAGPDNSSDYINFAFVEGANVRPWARFKGGYARQCDAAAVVAGTPDRADLALAYAQASGRCARCGRVLTVPASLHAGYGPECAKKI